MEYPPVVDHLIEAELENPLSPMENPLASAQVETFCQCWCQMDVDSDSAIDLDDFSAFFSKRKVDRWGAAPAMTIMMVVGAV